MQHRRRDEQGAAAILFALTAVVMIGLGALAVDVGQAFAKRSLLQTDVDLAVMAATAELDSAGSCNPEVVAKAEEFLEKAENAVPGQYDVDLTGSSDDLDGFISCSGWRVDLWAPRSHVEFGLAGVLTEDDGLDVRAHAAAQIKAANGGATLPFFSVQGCDYGQQSIRNDSGSPTAPTNPPLDPSSATTNGADFTITPTSTAAGTTSLTITLNGTGFKDVDGVGFTGAGGPPYHYVVPVPKIKPADATKPISVAVPSEVLAVEDVWYVRVHSETNSGVQEWSPTATAQRFTVGAEKLYCDDSNEGNFGTIDLPRTDTPFTLEWNMIKGVMPRLVRHPSPNGECSGQAGSVESKTVPVDGTNCLLTEPGLKVAATNDGLIGGKGGLPGRLDADSTSGCSRNKDDGRTTGTIQGRHINDDVLTCFIVNGADIGDLVAGNVVGTQALSADIFGSPRFFWLPVLDTDPYTGKKSWPIVDFRPGFITDQALTATHEAPGTITAFNGLEEDSSGIREVKVVLFDELALPEFAPASGGEDDYTGSGPKTIVLVE